MKRYLSIMILLCLLMTGCRSQNTDTPTEVSTEPTQPTTDCGANDASTPTEVSTEPTQPDLYPYPYSDTFYVVDDTLQKEGEIFVRGTDCSTLDGSDLHALYNRFDNAEITDGIFPHYFKLYFVFEDEIPTLIHWKTDDGFRTGDEGEVAPDGEGKAYIYMGYNKGAVLSSSLNYIPVRKLRMVFEYDDRTVEYLMVMEDTTRFEERETIDIDDVDSYPTLF